MVSAAPFDPNSLSNGLFYVGADDLMRCFSTLDQAAYKNEQGYQNYWYDVDDDSLSGQDRTFTF